jgi:hypothetical protein
VSTELKFYYRMRAERTLTTVNGVDDARQGRKGTRVHNGAMDPQREGIRTRLSSLP